MSAPAIALITIGCAAYLIIGLYMALALGMLFKLGGEPESLGIIVLQIILCFAALFLWAPGIILMFVGALIMAPFS